MFFVCFFLPEQIPGYKGPTSNVWLKFNAQTVFFYKFKQISDVIWFVKIMKT